MHVGRVTAEDRAQPQPAVQSSALAAWAESELGLVLSLAGPVYCILTSLSQCVSLSGQSRAGSETSVRGNITTASRAASGQGSYLVQTLRVTHHCLIRV